MLRHKYIRSVEALSLFLIFSCYACSHKNVNKLAPADQLQGTAGYSKLDTEPRHQVQASASNDNELLQTWVNQSAKREKIANKLETLLKKKLCKALMRQKEFTQLRTTDTVKHNLGPPPKLPLTINASPLGILPVQTAANTQNATSQEFIASLEAHFSIFETVDHCEIHTHRFVPNETSQTTLQLTMAVAGLDEPARPIEQHLQLELVFEPDKQLTQFTINQGTTIQAPYPIFREITSAALGGGQFKEEKFSPLGLQTAGNLDFGGLSVIDVNRDDLLDIYVARSGPNLLFIQSPDGTFKQRATELGVADEGNSRGVVFADMDADGDLDLLVANMALSPETAVPLRYYEQANDGTFRNASEKAFGEQQFTSQFTHIAVADVDGDGDLDAFIANYGNTLEVTANHIVEADNGEPNLLLLNNGQGVFSQEAIKRGLTKTDWTYAAGFVDIDKDGDQDLYLANDWGINRLYINDGRGFFDESAAAYNLAHPGAGMGVVWTDLDRNGDLDLYVSNMYSNAGNRILPFAKPMSDEVKRALLASAGGNNAFLNPTPGSTQDAATQLNIHNGGWAWGAIAFDFDLDGDEDIYQTNGYFTGGQPKDL